MKSSAYAMIAAAFLTAAPAAAEEEWRTTADGVQHIASGAVCPSTAGKFVLGFNSTRDEGFTCQYDYVCEGAGCEAEVAQAGVVFDPSTRYGAEFRELMKEQGIMLHIARPELGGIAATVYGASTIEGQLAQMGFWIINNGHIALYIGGMFNEPAKPSLVALIEATARLNPVAAN